MPIEFLQIDDDTYIPVGQITYLYFSPKDMAVSYRALLRTADGNEYHVTEQAWADSLRNYVEGRTENDYAGK